MIEPTNSFTSETIRTVHETNGFSEDTFVDDLHKARLEYGILSGIGVDEFLTRLQLTSLLICWGVFSLSEFVTSTENHFANIIDKLKSHDDSIAKLEFSHVSSISKTNDRVDVLEDLISEINDPLSNIQIGEHDNRDDKIIELQREIFFLKGVISPGFKGDKES